MNKKLFQELREENEEEYDEQTRSDSENEQYEIKNNLQFVQEQGVT